MAFPVYKKRVRRGLGSAHISKWIKSDKYTFRFQTHLNAKVLPVKVVIQDLVRLPVIPIPDKK